MVNGTFPGGKHRGNEGLEHGRIKLNRRSRRPPSPSPLMEGYGFDGTAKLGHMMFPQPPLSFRHDEPFAPNGQSHSLKMSLCIKPSRLALIFSQIFIQHQNPG